MEPKTESRKVSVSSQESLFCGIYSVREGTHAKSTECLSNFEHASTKRCVRGRAVLGHGNVPQKICGEDCRHVLTVKTADERGGGVELEF